MIRLCLATVCMTVLCACMGPGDVSPPGAPTQYWGVLHGGVKAVGGETTGWIVREPGQTGGMEVDISQIPEQAKAMQGKLVTIHGRVEARQYIERGKIPVLIAESITPGRPPETQPSTTQPASQGQP